MDDGRSPPRGRIDEDGDSFDRYEDDPSNSRDRDDPSPRSRSRHSRSLGQRGHSDEESGDYNDDSHDDQYDDDSRDHNDYSDSKDDPQGRSDDEDHKHDEDRKDEDFEEEEKKENEQQDENKENEEEKKDEEAKEEEIEDLEEVEQAPLIPKSVVYSRERSYWLAHRDRAVLEQQVMDLPEKTELVMERTKNQADSKASGFLSKLQNDGIYKIGTTEGIVTPTLTKPIDLTNRQPHRLKVRSAILCERLNSLKKKHFKLEIILGKIILRDHKLFINEDHEAIKLKELHEEFERVVGLGMIPFYKSRLDELQKDLYKAEDNRKVDEDHVKFLKATIKDIKKRRNQEKKKVKNLGIALYEKWIKIQKIRKDNDFQSTTVELKAREHKLPDRKTEIIFYLNRTEPQKKTISGKSMPPKEKSRRNQIKNLQAKIELYVNDKKVDTTNPEKVSWPNFEAEFGERFLLFLYTMPKSIELRIILEGDEVCRIPVEIPGTKVESLTSSYAISKEVKFSKQDYRAQQRYDIFVKDGKIDPLKIQEQQQKYEEYLTRTKKKEEEKKEENKEPAVAEPNNAPAAAAPKAEKPPPNPANNKYIKMVEDLKKGHDVRGLLYFKTEWKEDGSRMPPAIRILLEKEHQNEDPEDTEIPKSKIIDVNDPKYKSLVKAQKENNENLRRLIQRDSLNPLHDLEPFRHIQLINQDTHYELVNLDIPMLEQEVVNDPTLSYLIEKFSKLGAQQTYDQMLKEVKSYSGTERLQDMSKDVLERRQKFMEKIKRVQKDIKTGKNKPNINYNSIIEEEGGIDAKNPCAGLAAKVFAPRRKLRPKITEKPAISIGQCSKANLRVQIMSGINIPVRNESIRAIENMNRAINENNQNPGLRNAPGRAGAPNPSLGGPQNDPYGGLNNSYLGGQYDRRSRTGYDNYARPLDQTGRDYDRDPRLGGTDPYGRNQRDRTPPPYSGYGSVANPYDNQPGHYGGINQPRGPVGGMGALQKAQMELTGFNKLIQGSVFIEVRLVSSRRNSERPQTKSTRE